MLTGVAERALDAALEFAVVPSFTRIGFEVRQRTQHWRALDRYDLHGRVVLVTGATSGIGLAAATAFARMGARVLVLGRDVRRTEDACATVRAEAGGGSIAVPLIASMDDPEQVRRAAEAVRREHGRLDVLVHNAGALAADYRRAPMGVEETSATQVAGPFLMTGLLLDLLGAHGGRVITVSSGGAYLMPLTVSGLDPARDAFNGGKQYARAKRAQITLTELWTERARGSGVTFQSMHPGWVDTPGLAVSLPRFRGLIGRLLRTPAQGADTIAWLAADAAALAAPGRFWLDRRPRAAHRLGRTREAETAERRSRLWAWCEEHAGWSLAASAHEAEGA